jgi:hypothetical protein
VLATPSWRLRLLVHYAGGTAAEVTLEVRERDFRLPVAGDVLPVRYDLTNPSRVEIDLPALRGQGPPMAPSPPPTEVELQAASDAWDAAKAKAAESLAAYQQAKAAGDDAGAARLLNQGKLFNAEQVRLGEDLKRLRARRDGSGAGSI